MRKYVKRATIMFAAALACTLAAGSVSAKKEPVNRVIVFGDSLSDGGFYVALDPTIPAGAGSFTTNPDPVAPEVVASELNLTLDTAYGADGTNYAVGGARVSEPNLLSVPIATQAAGFAATERFFNSDDLVYIQGGGNDFFAYVADGATDTSILTNAATELAELVDLLGRSGARRVVTMSVQSVGVAGGLLFNQTYEDELAALGVNALYFDMDALFDEVIADTATFGITNTVDVACTDSSLICTPDSYVATDANETYLRADSVHPAGITQRIQGEAIASLLLMLPRPYSMDKGHFTGKSCITDWGRARAILPSMVLSDTTPLTTLDQDRESALRRMALPATWLSIISLVRRWAPAFRSRTVQATARLTVTAAVMTSMRWLAHCMCVGNFRRSA